MSLPPLPWSDAGFARVFARVQEHAGLLPPSCVPATEEGICRAMGRAGISDFTLYLERLAADPAAVDDLLTELTIGETYFFRTPEHFDFLSEVVLPELQRLRGPAHAMRVWSAGCSSGEEPYSLAATLLRAGYGDRMEVLATDVSRTALARSQEAHYGQWSLRGAEALRMRPFLRQEGARYVLVPQVRERVRFDYLNLALDTWPSRANGIHALDVIFCRNVLIYFTRATIATVARRLHDSLAEGGFLITGPSDPPLGDFAPLEPLLTEWGVAWRRPPPGASRAAPLPPGSAPLPPASVARPALPRPTPLPAPAPPRAAPPLAAEPGPQGLETARQAVARGDWHEAARQAEALADTPEAAVMAVRALANLDAKAAVKACTEAAARHPLSVELRYLEALLLLGQGQLPEAERAVRQALYLEPSLAVVHLTQGHVLRRLGDTEGALRAFRTTERLCAALAPETPLRLGEGERADSLARIAHAERLKLEAAELREED